MGRTEIVMAACRATETAAPYELAPDPELALLGQALDEVGFSWRRLAWDDPDVDWREPSVVITKSTWDNDLRPGEYRAWAKRVSVLTTLVNPYPAIEWNIDKGYLADLAAEGAPIVPTRFVAPGEAWVAPAGEFVVKPAISAGGRSTALYRPSEIVQARAHVDELHRAGRRVMVQPYMASIETTGELKSIYLGGTFSHAVRIRPYLERGTGVVERLWEKPTFPERVTPTPAEMAIGGRAVAAAQRRLGVELAYARVDLVPDERGEPVVSELETIDPFLFLEFEPAAAAVLAKLLASLT